MFNYQKVSYITCTEALDYYDNTRGNSRRVKTGRYMGVVEGRTSVPAKILWKITAIKEHILAINKLS